MYTQYHTQYHADQVQCCIQKMKLGGGGGGATMLPCAVSTYWQTKGLCVTFWETLVHFSVTVEISGYVFPVTTLESFCMTKTTAMSAHSSALHHLTLYRYNMKEIKISNHSSKNLTCNTM